MKARKLAGSYKDWPKDVKDPSAFLVSSLGTAASDIIPALRFHPMSELFSIHAPVRLPRSHARSKTGSDGERIAAEFLTDNGYRLVLANFKVPIGRNSKGVAASGEIDIIALEDETICFVEVKTRTSDDFAAPHASVTRRKQRQITRTARVYRRIFGVSELPCRFDVVSIVLIGDSEPAIELIKGFWSESSFRKKTWTGDIY